MSFCKCSVCIGLWKCLTVFDRWCMMWDRGSVKIFILGGGAKGGKKSGGR